MSIRNKIGQTTSITSESLALQHFTDRYPLTRLFAHYLNDSQPRGKILFFYGDGGNGKSLLLRYLRERCCKRLRSDNWAYLVTLPDEEFVANFEVAEDAEAVPWAMLDFGMQPRGNDRPQEPFSALLMLRRALSSYGLQFPLYDFGSVWYLHRTQQLSKERLANLFPAEEMDLIVALSDTILNVLNTTTFGLTGLAKAVLGLINKHAGCKRNERLTLFLQRRKLDKVQVERIMQMDPDKELINELPILFAEDLNASMTMSDAPQRLVLCFDTHEAFWGYQRDLSNELYFQRDEWLRCFLTSLELEGGIVAVVAGRDRPRWPQATEEQGTIPEKYIDAQLVGHLSDTDALVYLDRVGVLDQPLCQSLLEAARVAANEIHPFYLGLCVDIVQAAGAKGILLTPDDFAIDPKLIDKEQTLIDRLLKYVDAETKDAIYVISACRSFDWDIYQALAQSLHFHASHAAFKMLTQFSFVWRSEQSDEGWYRIHDLLRRLLCECGEQRVRYAHEVMEQYYLAQLEMGDATVVIEATYHACCLDWKRGGAQWVVVFDKVLERSRYDLCRGLLQVRTGMIMEDSSLEYGDVCRAEGDYFASLLNYVAAEQKYREAVAAYDKVPTDMSDATALHTNKGVALNKISDVQRQLGQYEQALQSCEAAVISYEAVLQLAPNLVRAYNNKGAALQSLGELQVKLGLLRQGARSYRAAKDMFDMALQRSPNHVNAHVNKGNVLVSLGDLQIVLEEPYLALQSYHQADQAYDVALSLDPNVPVVYYNKARALHHQGNCHVQRGKFLEAYVCYTDAIPAYETALLLAPDWVMAYNSKGGLLGSLGELLAKLLCFHEAQQRYLQSSEAYQAVLERVPNAIETCNNKGYVLRRLSDMQAVLGEDNAALTSCVQAIAVLDMLLQCAPDHINAYNNKGLALFNKGLALFKSGRLYLEMGKLDRALVCLRDARAVFDQSLLLVPHDDYIQELREQVHQMIEELGRA